MNYKVKNQISDKKLIVALSVAISLLTLLGIFISGVALPFAAAFYAVLLLCCGSHRPAVPGAIAACSVALDVIMNGYLATFAVQFVIAGVIIMLAVRRGYNKSSLAAILTGIFVGFILLNLLLYAFWYTGEYSIVAASKYYLEIYDAFKAEIVAALTSIAIELPNGTEQFISSDSIAAMIDATAKLSIAFAIILGFLIAGIAIKCFTAFSVRIIENHKDMRAWHFSTGNVFAYAYAVAAIINLFLTDDTVFGIALANFYLIFMAVYGYIGFKLLIGFLRVSDRRLMILVIFTISIIILGIYVLIPLSIFGVYAVITVNRYATSGDADSINK